ncbi:MAG: rod shape-determining protein [Thaumarchaeota archaeon]|nr:rod shape-determining protein [Nitrososphaerota archaeon]
MKTSLKRISNALLNSTPSDTMAYENNDGIIAIDAGTGFVKCVSAHIRVSFPSVYGTRRKTRWEDPKEGTVEAVGYDAVKMSVYPDTVLVRAVLEGKIAEEKAFVAIIREAVKKLGRERDVGSLVVVMGLPYGAAQQKQYLEKLVERSLKPRQVLVIPQSIGTLLSEDARTGMVLSIGQGTTELVLFEDLKPVAGTSIPQACDYLYEDLTYLEHEKNIVDKKKVDALTTILANKLAVFQTKLNREYDVYVSGGGVLVERLCESLQAKAHDSLRMVKDPIYSNAQGLYKLGQMLSSTGGQQGISHPQ